jgi:hypothetical protein
MRVLAYAAGMNPDALTAWLAGQFDEAKPMLADVGGEVRLLIGHPGNPATAEWLSSAKIENPLRPTILEYSSGDLFLCQEMQKIPMLNLVYRIMERRADALDFVSRLHSRTDVDWTSLHELFQMV